MAKIVKFEVSNNKKIRVMKTYYLHTQKNAIFSLFGLLAVITSSCGSYQNSSYYNNDGVYGSEKSNTQTENKDSEQNTDQSNKYALQFRNMQDDYTYFTDVDNYNTQEQDTVVTVYKNDSNNNYAGWGNNSSDVTINYYNNGWGWNNWYSPYWGSPWNFGWNSWYSPYWGWNNWYGTGWGWNSYYGLGWGGYYGINWGGYYGLGWGYNGYYSNNVSYNHGRRGGNGYYNNGGRTSNRSNTTRPNFNSNSPRTQNATPRSHNATPRSQNTTPREGTHTPRTNTQSPRTSTPSSSSPRTNYSSPRSSSGGSFGGGSFGGGGRSGGGGGRGGRG